MTVSVTSKLCNSMRTGKVMPATFCSIANCTNAAASRMVGSNPSELERRCDNKRDKSACTHGRFRRDMMLGSSSTSLRNWKWLNNTQAMFACGNKSASPSNTSSWIYQCERAVIKPR